MINVAHIIGSMNRAGAETMLMNYFRLVDKKRFQFIFIYFTAFECDYDEEIQNSNGKIIRINESGPLPWKPLNRIIRLFQYLNKADINIVHSHMNVQNGIFLLAAFMANIKLRISHSHGTKNIYHVGIIKRLYSYFNKTLIKKFATHYLACGAAAAKFLYPSVQQELVTIIPNAIDLSAFMQAQDTFIKDSGLTINREEITLLQVGRFNPVKNHGFTLQLAKQLDNSGVRFKIIFAGSGVLEETLKEQVKTLQLRHRFRFLGTVKNIPGLMHQSDFLILPSLHEGFPLVLVEAQACGLQCLVSDNVSKEVDLGLNLVKFLPINNTAKWIAAITQNTPVSIDSNTILNILSRQGFNINSNIKHLEDLYESCR